jgi:hypothetical protein
MPWRYDGRDNKVEVVVDPQFRGNVITLAKARPVWIIDTPGNKAQIDDSWLLGKDLNLYEVSRYKVSEGSDREGNLLQIMGDLDDHRPEYELIVHGLFPSPSLKETLATEGFNVAELTEDGFFAVRIPGVRESLIGRSKPVTGSPLP